MADKKYDAIVIGGGPGGYVAGIRLGQLGINAAVIEKEYIGGVCLNWGCIPSKALISAAHLYSQAKAGEDMGIVVSDINVDAERLQKWKDGIVGKLTGGVRQLLKGNKVDTIEGEAAFTGPNKVRVKHGSESMEIEFKNAIIATGARPIHIPGFEIDEEKILTAKGAVNLKRIPKSMLIVGGGIIGMELGGVYQDFGTEVIVVEALDKILTGTDRDLVRPVERRFKAHGGKIHVNARAKSAKIKGDNVEVVFTVDGAEHTASVDCVLVAVGFRPNTEGLGLETTGVATDERGFIPVDEFMRTNASHIYAIGDVTGPPLLAHRASKQGEVAAEVIAGKPSAWDVVSIAAATFTTPEIATAGISETEAKERGLKVKIGKFPFAANGRALSVRGGDGWVKTIVDAESGLVLGVGIVGPNASDMISEAALALEMGALAEDVSLTVHPHPTLPEALNEAFRAALGEAIHALNR